MTITKKEAMETVKSPLLGSDNNDDIIIEMPTTTTTHEPLVWTRSTVALATILVLGTVSSSLIRQHVTNEVPKYVFSISVFGPFSGLVFYPLIALVLHKAGLIKTGLTRENFLITMWLMLPVALSFAVCNILTMYGTAGQAPGIPDVPTVLSLILQKLVVPVSLAMESLYERRCPRFFECIGVAFVMMGVVVAALAYDKGGGDNDSDGDDEGMHVHGPYFHAKVLCLLFASVPLATGFLLVKRASQTVPNVAEIELWAVLCLPETIFSVGLTYVAQHMQNYEKEQLLPMKEMTAELWTGLMCTVMGVSPPPLSDKQQQQLLPCPNAAKLNWLSLIPGFAYNLTIPVLVRRLEDSTVIPLLRTVALPLASLVAMSHVDPVIAASFSWEGVFGTLFAFFGLLLCYSGDFILEIINTRRRISTDTNRNLHEYC